jgi:hypothetical protein
MDTEKRQDIPSSSQAKGGRSVAIGGDISGSVVVTGDANIIGGSAVVTAGRDVRDVHIHYQDPTITLVSLLGSLRREIATQAPAGEKIDALEQIDELEQCLQAEHPDFGVFARVQQWFKNRLPELAGALTSVLLHPAVREAVKKQRVVLEEELELHRRNLHKLEERKAIYAASEVPLHLLNQIDTECNRIQELENLLEQADENVGN